MIREPFRFRETIATILADDPVHIAAAKDGILTARQALERYIAHDPFFAATFDPYTPDSDERIIIRMADATRRAGVGPMAAVAGAIAWAGVEAMQDKGAGFGVIDNGGDIALVSDRPVRVGSTRGRQHSPTVSRSLSRRRPGFLASARLRLRWALPSRSVLQMP